MNRFNGTMKYVINRLGQLVLSLFVLSLLVFILSRLAPGSPMKAYYGEALERMSQEQIRQAESKLGLDQSLLTQYVRWFREAVHGDFGISFQYKQPALDVVGQVIGNTAVLTVTSLLLIFLLGICLSMFCVKHEGSWMDRWVTRIGVATSSMPEFFAAMILILIFAVKLGMLPQSGAVSVGGGGVIDSMVHLVLPVMTIVITHLWYCAYLIRNRLADDAAKEYVLLCRAKGLTVNQILWKHCLKNIMPSVVNILAVFLPHLLGGTYVIEMVFSYPGIGKLGLDSAEYHDYNLLMLVCLVTGASVIIANMAAQIINQTLDPQIKEERGRML